MSHGNLENLSVDQDLPGDDRFPKRNGRFCLWTQASE